MKKVLFYCLLLIAVYSCKDKNHTQPNVENNVGKTVDNSADANEEWQYLFDGTSTKGWRGYNKESLPDNWIVEDEKLKALGLGGDSSGDIVYDEEFDEFELSLEWKMAEGGNSGIFYHIIENDEYTTAYMTGPEYQFLTQPIQAGNETHSIGADYGMYPTNYKGDTEILNNRWNTSRIRFTNEKVSYWLNGELTVEFVPWSSDWKKRKEEGKWNAYPDYGKTKSGLIGLQDHGSVAWFKNIKIKNIH